jgi:hypothetical protein
MLERRSDMSSIDPSAVVKQKEIRVEKLDSTFGMKDEDKEKKEGVYSPSISQVEPIERKSLVKRMEENE